MWIQKLKKTLNLFGLIIFLASCSSIKKSSAPINKETISDIKKSARTMEFLDNISVKLIFYVLEALDYILVSLKL